MIPQHANTMVSVLLLERLDRAPAVVTRIISGTNRREKNNRADDFRNSVGKSVHKEQTESIEAWEYRGSNREHARSFRSYVKGSFSTICSESFTMEFTLCTEI